MIEMVEFEELDKEEMEPKKWNKAERYVRGKLEEEFDQEFSKENFELGRPREADAVSEDEEIIAQVKSSKKFNELSSQQKAHRRNACVYDCKVMEEINAEHKIMAFVDESYYEWFKEESKGLINSDIEIRYFSDFED